MHTPSMKGAKALSRHEVYVPQASDDSMDWPGTILRQHALSQSPSQGHWTDLFSIHDTL